jgi:hypothetical protein
LRKREGGDDTIADPLSVELAFTVFELASLST